MKLKNIIFALIILAAIAFIFLINKDTPSEKNIIKKAITAGIKTDSNAIQNVANGINDTKRKHFKPVMTIIVYYFHPTARCESCINIENFTKEVIDTQFTKEQKKGIIVFRALNIEDSINEHYRNDYKLEYSTVILAKFIKNEQIKWKNLEHVWKFANDKKNFFTYATIEIKEFLKEEKL
jgi:hypothetical protein